MTVLFWTSLAIVFYTFIGYGIILWLFLKIKTAFSNRKIKEMRPSRLPTCSVVIAAFNEESFIREKITNTLALNYPTERLNIYVVADGSTDNTVTIIQEYPQIKLLYSNERKGKVHAINRAMEYINTDIVVFTDANTYLNNNALIEIGNHYADPEVGGVAGEKRIYSGSKSDASSAGESLYWKYESLLKKWDSALNTAIGAAGELFSIRRHLFVTVPESTILDDFMISMQIVQKGFKIVYEPEAYAVETASSSSNEELKRKIRIAAGGVQSIVKLKSLFYFWRNPVLSFQYISHRVLRWSITPFLLIIILMANTVLALYHPSMIYGYLLLAQITFYLLAVFGYIMEQRKVKFKIAFVPYYFCLMNYAVIAGIFRYWRGEHSAIWEKAERKIFSAGSSLNMTQEKIN